MSEVKPKLTMIANHHIRDAVIPEWSTVSIFADGVTASEFVAAVNRTGNRLWWFGRGFYFIELDRERLAVAVSLRTLIAVAVIPNDPIWGLNSIRAMSAIIRCINRHHVIGHRYLRELGDIARYIASFFNISHQRPLHLTLKAARDAARLTPPNFHDMQFLPSKHYLFKTTRVEDKATVVVALPRSYQLVQVPFPVNSVCLIDTGHLAIYTAKDAIGDSDQLPILLDILDDLDASVVVTNWYTKRDYHLDMWRIFNVLLSRYPNNNNCQAEVAIKMIQRANWHLTNT